MDDGCIALMRRSGVSHISFIPNKSYARRWKERRRIKLQIIIFSQERRWNTKHPKQKFSRRIPNRGRSRWWWWYLWRWRRGRQKKNTKVNVYCIIVTKWLYNRYALLPLCQVSLVDKISPFYFLMDDKNKNGAILCAHSFKQYAIFHASCRFLKKFSMGNLGTFFCILFLLKFRWWGGIKEVKNNFT